MNKPMKIRIEMPCPGGGIARVSDAETGKTLPCTALDLRLRAGEVPMLMMELLADEAQVIETWECTKVSSRPNDRGEQR